MKKLEQYLDRVCRGIGGPRALRQHVRQELREHLLDAMAQHKAAGLSEEAALEQALAEFGQAEEIRSELEAMHGQRMMAVVIEKAMQWQERTMRAKWLWATWAYLAAVLLIGLELLFITFNGIYILPKYEKLTRDGVLDLAILSEMGLSWIAGFFNGLSWVGRHATELLLLALAMWGLFEWRIKSENKPLIRLSVLGTTALGLMVVIALLGASLVISFCVGVPAVVGMTRPFAVEQVTTIDSAAAGLEQSLAKKDWATMQKQAEQARNALNRLSSGPALSTLTKWNETPTLDEMRAQLSSAKEAMREAEQAIQDKDAERLTPALRRFRQSFAPIRAAATRDGKP
jgi:hypothetical protein